VEVGPGLNFVSTIGEDRALVIAKKNGGRMRRESGARYFRKGKKKMGGRKTKGWRGRREKVIYLQ